MHDVTERVVSQHGSIKHGTELRSFKQHSPVGEVTVKAFRGILTRYSSPAPIRLNIYSLSLRTCR